MFCACSSVPKCLLWTGARHGYLDPRFQTVAEILLCIRIIHPVVNRYQRPPDGSPALSHSSMEIKAFCAISFYIWWDVGHWRKVMHLLWGWCSQRGRVQILSTFSLLSNSQSNTYPHYSPTITDLYILSKNGVLRPRLYARRSLWSSYWLRLRGRQQPRSSDSPMHSGNIYAYRLHDLRSYELVCQWFQQSTGSLGLWSEQHPWDGGFQNWCPYTNETVPHQSHCHEPVSTQSPSYIFPINFYSITDHWHGNSRLKTAKIITGLGESSLNKNGQWVVNLYGSSCSWSAPQNSAPTPTDIMLHRIHWSSPVNLNTKSHLAACWQSRKPILIWLLVSCSTTQKRSPWAHTNVLWD